MGDRLKAVIQSIVITRVIGPFLVHFHPGNLEYGLKGATLKDERQKEMMNIRTV